MKNNRDYKNFVKGNYYHIYNRGIEKRAIFLDEEDYRVFTFFLEEAFYPERSLDAKIVTSRRTLLPVGAFTLKTYCLMPNHYHFLIRQESNISISKLVSKICTSYSKYFNKKYDRVGHLFQDAFKATLIKSDEQFQWTIEYIGQNPVKAGLVFTDSEYPWSYVNDDNSLFTAATMAVIVPRVPPPGTETTESPFSNDPQPPTAFPSRFFCGNSTLLDGPPQNLPLLDA